MDAVYILGKGSLAKNEEIRYSVRSLDQNMIDLGDVYVVGEKPGCLPKAIHIPAEDPHAKKWQNALHKTKIACEHSAISKDFLFMNDDFFMLNPFTGDEFPFYALEGSDGGPDGQNFFGIHCPIKFNKELYSKLPLPIESPGNHSPRSFYANFYRFPFEFASDFILRYTASKIPLENQILDREFFSISNDLMLDHEFRILIDHLFPAPSRFE